VAGELARASPGPLRFGETPGAACVQILSEMPPSLQPCCPRANPCHGSPMPDLEEAGLCHTPGKGAGSLACSSDRLEQH